MRSQSLIIIQRGGYPAMTDIKPVVRGKAAVNGAQLYYEYADDGEALVLLHAGLADSRMWDFRIGPPSPGPPV
jgi:hypothetical protein